VPLGLDGRLCDAKSAWISTTNIPALSARQISMFLIDIECMIFEGKMKSVMVFHQKIEKRS
jgi:hypothetical protein